MTSQSNVPGLFPTSETATVPHEVQHPSILTVFDTNPEMLKHKAEIDAAIRDNDHRLLKSIFQREGVEWISPKLPPGYKPDTSY